CFFVCFKSFFSHLRHSLRRIGNHLFASLKLFYRSPVTVFLLIIFPIILLLLFGSIFAHQTSFIYQLEVQDKDITFFSEGFVQSLENNEFLEVNRLDITIDPKEYLQENGLHACLIIPANWTANRFNPLITTSNVTLIVDPNSYTAKRVVEIVSSSLRNYDLENSLEEPLVLIDIEDFYSNTLSYIDFFLPGIIGIIILNTGILGTLNRQIHFRNSGLFRKLATTPITRWEYVTAEILWQFSIAFITTLLAILTAWIAFGFSWLAFDPLILLILLVGVIVFSGIGLLLSQLLRKSNVALGIGTLITIPFLFLSGVFFDISGIKFLSVISKFSPLTFIVDALRASMITNNISFAWANIGISFAIGALTFILGVFLTQWDSDKS
ncbi:MAG: ABC transporter permease, partial [Candidatus Thorarchaeota archaeon]